MKKTLLFLALCLVLSSCSFNHFYKTVSCGKTATQWKNKTGKSPAQLRYTTNKKGNWHAPK